MLPDVNVLLAVSWPNHVHHESAVGWFREAAPQGWATTAITELGLVRLSCNAAVVGEPLQPVEAVRQLELLRRVGRHERLPDDLDVADASHDWDELRGHRQVTDAHLVALAATAGGRLATFDDALADRHPRDVLRLPRT